MKSWNSAILKGNGIRSKKEKADRGSDKISCGKPSPSHCRRPHGDRRPPTATGRYNGNAVANGNGAALLQRGGRIAMRRQNCNAAAALQHGGNGGDFLGFLCFRGIFEENP